MYCYAAWLVYCSMNLLNCGKVEVQNHFEKYYDLVGSAKYIQRKEEVYSSNNADINYMKLIVSCVYSHR